MADAPKEPKEESAKWLPLESNPDLLTAFVRALGVKPPAAFVDVWSFDAESAAMFPPMLAVCLLYPMDAVEEKRKGKLKLMDAAGVPGLVYCRQKMDVHGNACGSIAAVHAVCNNLSKLSVDDSSPLRAFQRDNAGKAAELVAEALANAKVLHDATAQVASLGQTQVPDAEDDVNHHFVCFLAWNGQLLELDGLKPGPVDHGPVTPEDLLARTAAIIRDEMMPLADGNINFSAVGLVESDPNEEEE